MTRDDKSSPDAAYAQAGAMAFLLRRLRLAGADALITVLTRFASWTRGSSMAPCRGLEADRCPSSPSWRSRITRSPPGRDSPPWRTRGERAVNLSLETATVADQALAPYLDDHEVIRVLGCGSPPPGTCNGGTATGPGGDLAHGGRVRHPRGRQRNVHGRTDRNGYRGTRARLHPTGRRCSAWQRPTWNCPRMADVVLDGGDIEVHSFEEGDNAGSGPSTDCRLRSSNGRRAVVGMLHATLYPNEQIMTAASALPRVSPLPMMSAECPCVFF